MHTTIHTLHTPQCPNAVRRVTDTGKTCTFPQRNYKKEWVCGCYSLRDATVVTNENTTQAYCVVCV